MRSIKKCHISCQIQRSVRYTLASSLIKRKGDLAVELAFRTVWIPLYQRIFTPLSVFEIICCAEARTDRPHGSVALRCTAIVFVTRNVALATTVWLPPDRATTTRVAWSESAHRTGVTVYTLIKVH